MMFPDATRRELRSSGKSFCSRDSLLHLEMSAAIAPTSSHIPAWKKIGLRLKNPEPEGSSYAPITFPRADPPNGESRIANPRKAKRKSRSEQLTEDSQRATKRSRNVDASVEPLVATTQSIVGPNVERRKSVTFSADTKQEDGDSIAHLKQQIAAVEERSVDSANQREQEHEEEQKPGSTKARAKKKRKQTKLKEDDRLTPHSPQPYLEYLENYHKSRDTWKFSKPLQIQLFKHVLCLDLVPSSYDSALISYLKGLQSAGASERLRDQASKIREADETWLNAQNPEKDVHPDRRQKMDLSPDVERDTRNWEAYRAELARYEQYLRQQCDGSEDELPAVKPNITPLNEEAEQRLIERKRAELLLSTLKQNQKPKSQPPRGNLDLKRPRGNPMLERDSARMSGIAVPSAGKKIVFDQEGIQHDGAQDGRCTANGINGIQNHTTTPEDSKKRRKKRGKKKRKSNLRTAVYDSDDTSSNDSSSDSDVARLPNSNIHATRPQQDTTKAGRALSVISVSSGRSEQEGSNSNESSDSKSGGSNEESNDGLSSSEDDDSDGESEDESG